MSINSIDFNLITKLFLSKVNINVIFDYLGCHINELTSDQNQERLLLSTIDHKLMNKYPMSLKYRQRFVKQLMKTLETNELNVCEKVFISYSMLLLDFDLNKCEMNLNYLSYVLSDGQTVSLKESDNLVIDGTTGLKSWSAAKHLYKFFELNRHLIDDKVVLELGSGIGLTGICILKTCLPSLMTFSDHHSVVLEVLRHNIDINNVREKSVVFDIDWNIRQTLDNYLNDNNPDVIIAADVVFDPSVTESLCRVLNQLLVDCRRVCYICCTLRCDKTIEHFRRVVEEEYKLKLQEMYFYDKINDLKSFCFDSINTKTFVFKIHSD